MEYVKILQHNHSSKLNRIEKQGRLHQLTQSLYTEEKNNTVLNDTSGFALSVTYAECVWIARELLAPCCGASPGCLGLDVSQTKACPNKINVFVLLCSEWALSCSSRAEQTK